jgi:hypothetical protein
MALQSQSQKNSEPQRNFRFGLMAQRPQAAWPTNEWKWHSRSVLTGRKGALFIVMSKVQVPSERSNARAVLEASELSGCMRIQPMPVPAQSVFKKQGREESQRARQGEEVIMLSFNSVLTQSV